MEEVCARFRTTRRQLRRLIARGEFPAGIRTSPHEMVFEVADIVAHEEANRIKAEKAKGAKKKLRRHPSQRPQAPSPSHAPRRRACE